MSTLETAAVILAAGAGTRMKSDVPKVLHRVCGRPMLRFVLDVAKAAAPSRQVVVVGSGKDDVVAAFAKSGAEFAEQKLQLGTGDALKAARERLADFRGTLLVLSGDVPLVRAATLQALLDAHRAAKNDATVLTVRRDDPQGYGRILRDENDDSFAGILEDAEAAESILQIKEVNAGLYAFEAPQIFSHLEKLRANNKKREYFLTDAIAEIRRSGGRVGTFEAADADEVAGVNTRRELARVASVMRRRILDRLMDEGVTILDPSTTYVDADVTIGKDTVILPFTAIRGDVTIGQGCEIGPFAHVRDGARLEDKVEIGNFVEVKKSTIGARTKAKHLAYVGDAEVGAGANIGAGTITANFDGKAKHVTHIGDGAFVGSGTIIVAPATVGRNAVTGAGSVVTRGTEIPAGETYVGVPARKHLKKRG